MRMKHSKASCGNVFAQSKVINMTDACHKFQSPFAQSIQKPHFLVEHKMHVQKNNKSIHCTSRRSSTSAFWIHWSHPDVPVARTRSQRSMELLCQATVGVCNCDLAIARLEKPPESKTLRLFLRMDLDSFGFMLNRIDRVQVPWDSGADVMVPHGGSSNWLLLVATADSPFLRQSSLSRTFDRWV